MISCESVLLQKSLELFLKEHLSSYDNADFLIVDREIESEKPQCIVSSNPNAYIRKPFSRSQLLIGVEEFYRSIAKERGMDEPVMRSYSLEGELAELSSQFIKDVTEIVYRHCNKK